MKLVDLFKKHKWEDVQARLLELYPDQDVNIEGYEYVFYLLPTLEPEDSEGMKLCIRHADNAYLCKEDQEVDEWEDVFGKNGELTKDFDGEVYRDEDGNTFEQTWALEFQRWNLWGSMDVDEETLQNYKELDIIVHSLWEMTFCGWDQEDIQEQKEELDRRCKEIEDGTAELIPWEEVKERLEKELEGESDETADS